ncbi:MAG: hypothetical protein CO042_04425 [Parcubacteria group bacterium CG_4_9_14_0_2_um_filter_41_8]|nr:MAG: hypothetical protein COV79_00300 [Parcubacteria group bacterium CG11_big_fil_rev_8_21_14_0_20_41_14]PIR57282.1 MAG: hypothetical protein COU72_01760 [Parcubacteria group bacterium CG10_big_fil_rev_8_21_14_0_10_41_35]PJC40316.1 MAG: hypothetical protein CO042_04425 [Parcubacteria group bacterium CG_4_9_14_0_2_um_filter_41_8]
MEQTETQNISLEAKIDAIYASVEKTRKYFMWTLIITVALVVLPLIGLMFVLPSFIQGMTSGLMI